MLLAAPAFLQRQAPAQCRPYALDAMPSINHDSTHPTEPIDELTGYIQNILNHTLPSFMEAGAGIHIIPPHPKFSLDDHRLALYRLSQDGTIRGHDIIAEHAPVILAVAQPGTGSAEASGEG